jgi:hypothetical protein
LGDAGVVDQHVDAAEVLDDPRDGLFDLRLVGDVGGEAQVTFAQGSGGVAGGGFVEVEDDHAGALLSEGGSGGATDTASGGGAGDDCDFALKEHGRDLV